MKMADLTNKTVLITGGTRGIGKAFVEVFSKAGANIIFTGTKDSYYGALTKDVKIVYKKLDMLNEQSMKTFLKFIEAEKMDVLINNAGINKIEPVYEIEPQTWENIIKVNLTSCMNLTKHVSMKMISEQIQGRILNISSIFGDISREKRGSYSSSKSGLLGFTRASALDLAPYNILVNALSPGFTDTELTRRVLGEKGIKELASQVPLGRVADVEEIAFWALFLCSDMNTYITGQNFFVDGGFIIQ